MKWRTVLLLLDFWLQDSLGALRGQCGECLPNNVACLDERQFATCLNGKLTNNVTPCPANTVCTAETIICQSPLDGFRAVCFNDNCGNCEPPNRFFACLDKTTYGFCYDGMEPDPDSIRLCPLGSVCSVNSRNVCVPEAEGGIASCVPVEEDTTTTTAEPTQGPIIDPDTFCANQRSTGNFKATDDPSCKEYIYCYVLAGQYLGNRYICEGYFNAETAQCQAAKPNDC